MFFYPVQSPSADVGQIPDPSQADNDTARRFFVSQGPERPLSSGQTALALHRTRKSAAYIQRACPYRALRRNPRRVGAAAASATQSQQLQRMKQCTFMLPGGDLLPVPYFSQVVERKHLHETGLRGPSSSTQHEESRKCWLVLSRQAPCPQHLRCLPGGGGGL